MGYTSDEGALPKVRGPTVPQGFTFPVFSRLTIVLPVLFMGTSAQLLALAIAWLWPASGPARRIDYADTIAREARWYNVEPALIAAIIQVESGWRRTKRSSTHDYGLMQVHTARRGSSRFWGRERELFDARTNIREGTRLLAMWRDYHAKWCENDTKTSAHDWVAHYKWGKRVHSTEHAARVRQLEAAINAHVGAEVASK